MPGLPNVIECLRATRRRLALSKTNRQSGSILNVGFWVKASVVAAEELLGWDVGA